MFGHGLGVGLYESPMISRPHSLEHPVEIDEGMVFALETCCPAQELLVGDSETAPAGATP
jgi:Xaa-Pro dipeptidase